MRSLLDTSLLALAGLALAVPLSAGPVQVDDRLIVLPAVPDPGDEVRIRVESACPSVYDEPLVDGTTVTLVHADTDPPLGAPCSLTLPWVDVLFIGRLPAGTYVVELLFRSQDGSLTPQAHTSFEVTTAVRYGVRSGTYVEGCGGIAGRCDQYRLSGWLEIASDPAAGLASITSADLELVSKGGPPFSFPAPGDLQLTELLGSSDAGELRFVSPGQSPQLVEMRLVPVDGGLVLTGSYDEGCCDRFVFQLAGVLLEPQPRPTGGFPLRNGRFEVSVAWTDSRGASGVASAVGLSDEAAWFWFFTPGNAELLVKVLDGCALFGRYWFFAAGLTDVGVEITVADTETGRLRRYESPAGSPFVPVLDTAFEACSRR